MSGIITTAIIAGGAGIGGGLLAARAAERMLPRFGMPRPSKAQAASTLRGCRTS